MKFSAFSTVLLISSVAATQTATTASEAPKTVTTRSSLNMLALESDYIWNNLKNFLSLLPAPKCTLKATLVPPEPETEGIVAVPAAQFKFASAGDFYKALHESSALEVVFHPSALYYLARLESGKVLKDAKVDKLSDIIFALILRGKTLSKTYSASYVSKAYSDCMTHIWGLLTESGDAKPEAWAWPCESASKCDHQAGATFLKGVFSFEACKEVMKPQIKALAHVLSEAIAKDALLQNSAANVRDALKHTVLEAKFTNNLLYSGFSSLQEMTAASAAQKINDVLADLASINESEGPYKKASEQFAAKCKELESKHAEEEKTLEEKIESGAKSSPAPVATPTEPEVRHEVAHEQEKHEPVQPTTAPAPLTEKSVKPAQESLTHPETTSS